MSETMPNAILNNRILNIFENAKENAIKNDEMATLLFKYYYKSKYLEKYSLKKFFLSISSIKHFKLLSANGKKLSKSLRRKKLL